MWITNEYNVDETLVCDHSMKAVEKYFHVVLFHGIQGGSQYVDNILLPPFFWTLLRDHNILILLTTFC